MRRLVLVLAVALIPWPAGAHDHGAAPRAGAVRSAASLYELDAAFVDQRGASVGLDVARGHPVIIGMFYASCRDACPLMIAVIRRIEAEASAAIRADLRVVLVTLDPAHDTPDVLRSVADLHGLDGERWRLLTGSAGAVRSVAAVLGVRYRRLSSGEIAHSTTITLLDRAGVVAARVEDVMQPVTPILERLARQARVPGKAASE
jgi:protein SCO1